MQGKIKLLIVVVALVLSGSIPQIKAKALSCPDLRIVFARGSGGERNVDPNYLEYKNTIETKLKTTSLDYEFIDLDYPAVGVGVDNFRTTVGAYVGAGDAYEFGDSVNAGVKNLVNLVNNECKNTKYIIGGYSQGAMVVSKSLKALNADKVIYAATFGDPKIYLPEGKGLFPEACNRKNLSNYRTYVPDCHAYKGLLGAYEPYQPAAFIDKLGTWCNKNDVFCSSHFNVYHHITYIDDGLYEDASRVIFDKITKHFGLKNTISSPHDTAILIDSTTSMSMLFDKYKSEAKRLASETLNAGGRVALYDYRDLGDPYMPVEHCNFNNCTLETFTSELDRITLSGGGDNKESLLSASFHVMKNLTWKKGATKSLVILTDDGFLSPDRDGITFDEVVNLSKSIDPVNFYIITNAAHVEEYQELADATDGKAVILDDQVGLLTDEIIARYDSLPQIEDYGYFDKPELKVTNVTQVSDTEIKVEFDFVGTGAVVVLDGQVLGISMESSITVSNLKPGEKHSLILTPTRKLSRGDSVEIKLLIGDEPATEQTMKIPKAPNTGAK